MNALKNFYKRTTYLFYYLKMMDWPKFWQFFHHVRRTTKKNSMAIWIDAIASVYRYNIGLIDYFYFRFYEKDGSERGKWMGTGYKYEYDLIMNPVSQRHILQNKIHFFEAFAPFVKHATCTIDDLRAGNEKAFKVLNNPSGKIAIKDALGQCGWDVEIKHVSDFKESELIAYMNRKGFNLAEEFIVQHPALSKLSDTGLNTVRIITQLNANGGVDFIGPTLRITINSPVDNMAVGNIAAPIDAVSGIIKGKGAYQDIRKQPEENHPITGVRLIGFQVPYWPEVLQLCREAALYNRANKSIGWDVAITSIGPAFVEGNHNWCKLLWQLPAGEGLKHVLESYRKEAPSIIALNNKR